MPLDFAPETVNKTYCDALEDNCVGGIPKTKTDQAVFLCMNDEPATIQLFCACGGKCLNENVTSNIAHCDAPCVNNGKCMNVFQDMDKHMDMGMNMRENMDMHMDLGRKIDK